MDRGEDELFVVFFAQHKSVTRVSGTDLSFRPTRSQISDTICAYTHIIVLRLPEGKIPVEIMGVYRLHQK